MHQEKFEIAIHGACVSRDNFNSKFNSNYKDRYSVTLLQNQSSIISSVAKPLLGIEDELEGLNDWSRSTVLGDTRKEFFRSFEASRENTIIIDNFSDVRFGYTNIRNTRVTHNVWHIGTSKFESYFAGAVDHKPVDNMAEYLTVYREAVRIFIQKIRAINPNTTIILNCARAASNERNATGLVENKYKMDNFNEAWKNLDEAFIEIVPECNTICVSADKMVAWDQHPWGAGPVHYIPEFYEEFLEKLDRLTSKRPNNIGHLWGKIQKLFNIS